MNGYFRGHTNVKDLKLLDTESGSLSRSRKISLRGLQGRSWPNKGEIALALSSLGCNPKNALFTKQQAHIKEPLKRSSRIAGNIAETLLHRIGRPLTKTSHKQRTRQFMAPYVAATVGKY